MSTVQDVSGGITKYLWGLSCHHGFQRESSSSSLKPKSLSWSTGFLRNCLFLHHDSFTGRDMSDPVQIKGSGPSSEQELPLQSEPMRCRATCSIYLGAGIGSSRRTCLLPRQPIFNEFKGGVASKTLKDVARKNNNPRLFEKRRNKS